MPSIKLKYHSYAPTHQIGQAPSYQFWSSFGHRYTEYVSMKDLGDYNWEPEWESPIDHEELYDLRTDPQENYNV